LPVVPIHDLAVRDNDLVAATHGRSFWILDDLTPLHQLTTETAAAPRRLYKPRDVWRLRGGGGGGGDEDGAQRQSGRNPPNGAVVFFYFKAAPDSEVTLEFLDARDSTVRRFSSRPREPADSLRVSAGMNRFVWNLRYPNATGFPGLIMWSGNLQGPVAPPGTYKVRLRTAGWTATESFVVKKDPRVVASDEDLQAQFTLLNRIRERVSAANDAVRRIRAVKEQLDGVATRARRMSGDSGARIATAADSLKTKLSAVEEA